jgi:hypothetical protein
MQLVYKYRHSLLVRRFNFILYVSQFNSLIKLLILYDRVRHFSNASCVFLALIAAVFQAQYIVRRVGVLIMYSNIPFL